MRLRSQLALSGGLGVAGGAALTGGTIFLLQRLEPAPLLTGLTAWILFGFLLFFSLAEIPVMIFGMRWMMSASSGKWVAILTNAVFTFFAAVYAAPFMLLTGRVDIGVALAGLGLVRFSGALLFVPSRQPSAPNSQPPASSNPHPIWRSEEL